MAFKDNFRIEKIYFQRVKDDAQILGSWKNDPRRYSREEIVRVAKDACDSILMVYRLLGESWNDALNQIKKLSAELEALASKNEAYHDELNEKIDEVNNYLNTQIKNLEIRVENIENSIDAFGGLPSNASANVGDVLTKGTNGNEWKAPTGGDAFLIEARFNETSENYDLYHNNVLLTVADLKNAADNKYLILYLVEYDEDEEANINIYFPIEDIKRYDVENDHYYYELDFTRRFYPRDYNGLGINSNSFYVYFSNYNDEEEIEEDYLSIEYSVDNETNTLYCVVQKDTIESIFTTDVSNFRVTYNPSFSRFISAFPLTPNAIRVINTLSEGLIYILSNINQIGYVDGVSYQGVLFTFTNFTFTNGVLNTRSLFLYRNGIAEYSATP